VSHLLFGLYISYSHVQAVLFVKHNKSSYVDKHQESDIYIEGNLEGLKVWKEIKDLGNHSISL
jgi:hypothetical protein